MSIRVAVQNITLFYNKVHRTVISDEHQRQQSTLDKWSTAICICLRYRFSKLLFPFFRDWLVAATQPLHSNPVMRIRKQALFFLKFFSCENTLNRVMSCSLGLMRKAFRLPYFSHLLLAVAPCLSRLSDQWKWFNQLPYYRQFINDTLTYVTFKIAKDRANNQC